MNHQRISIVIIFQLILFNFDHVKAQGLGPDFAGPDDTDFQPSLAVVIGILSVMFVLTFFLLAYAKFCHRRESAVLLVNRNPNQIGTSNRFSGIDKTVIESLPFFRFSSLKGSKEGLECSVCLSKFEDIEVLRLLPKCKHAFHISCIDYWLEKHSSCPLCRQKVSSEDLELITYSSSMRFLWNNNNYNNSTNQSNHHHHHLGGEEEPTMELFVEREESQRGSSRFSIGSSFRKIEKDHHDEDDKEKQLLILQTHHDQNQQQQVLHKHNHKIVVSDFVYKNRWSNVSSSDLIFLNSEMLNDMSSTRFHHASNSNSITITTEENDEITKIKEEMGMKRSFQNKVGTSINNINNNNNVSSSSVMSCGEQRSVSEITAHSRYGILGSNSRLRRDSSLTDQNNVKEERIRRAWLSIAKRTVQWFANREERPQNQNLHPSNV